MPLPKDVDNDTIRKKMYLGLLSSPFTLLPFAAGVTAMTASLAISIRPDLGLLAGLLGILGGAGSFVTQLVLGGAERAKVAIVDAQREAHEHRERALDALEQQLLRDNDPRTEAALRDLRLLAQAFDTFTQSKGSKSTTLWDFQAKSEEIFEQCVRSLEQSLSLWDTASKLHIRQARDPILARREDILSEVLLSIQQLGKILAGLQEVNSVPAGGASLRDARKELDQNLAMAKQVNLRLHALEKELSATHE